MYCAVVEALDLDKKVASTAVGTVVLDVRMFLKEPAVAAEEEGLLVLN
jgi:hypothetical protein